MSLSMRERLGLQKSVKQNLAALRGGEVGMRERLSLQKQIKADMAKLGGDAKPEASGPEPVTRDNASAGDAVEWRNEMGTIAGNFRGITDDGRHAVIVANGMQMSAPIGEVFKPQASDEPAPTEAPAHERIKAAMDAGNANEAMRVAQGLTANKEAGQTAKQVVMAELLRAGLKVAGDSVPEMLAHAWPQMQETASEATAETGSSGPSETQTNAARHHMERLNEYVAMNGNLPSHNSPNREEGEAGMQMLQLIEVVKEPGVEAWVRENYNPDNLLDRALAMQGKGRATVSNLQAAPVESSELPSDVTPKSGQVVMNAPRPIAGHQTSEGPSINGRHYAVIDLASDDAQNMVEQNRKLDAVVLVPASKDAIEAAATARMPHRYRSRLDTVGEQARNSQVQKYVAGLRTDTMTHSELLALLGSEAGTPASDDSNETGEGSGATDETTLTSQAARGDFNGLGLPEFIDKLKEAYSADEDLDGAKAAASGYLEANLEELEAA